MLSIYSSWVEYNKYLSLLSYLSPYKILYTLSDIIFKGFLRVLLTANYCAFGVTIKGRQLTYFGKATVNVHSSELKS